MQKHYSRSERRSIAKAMGLLGNKEPFGRWTERVARSIEGGRQLHTQFMNTVETNIRNGAADREADVIKSLTESHGEEIANNIATNNRALERARRDELAKRRAKQKAAYEAKLTSKGR